MDINDYRPRRPKPQPISLFGTVTLSKRSKTIITILILVVGIPFLLFQGLKWKIDSEKNHMRVPDTKCIDRYIYLLKDDFVQMFLIKDKEGNYIAIDAAANPKNIRQILKDFRIDSTKVTGVFLTHSDGDHTGSLALFPKAKVYLSKAEEQMINGKTARMLFAHNKLSRKDYTLLNDNETVQLGSFRIKGILTPGHTPGSMCYLVNDSLLFTGDAFGLSKDKVIERPNSFFTMDMNQAVASFSKIQHINTAKYLFTSHYGFTIDYKDAVKDGLK